MKKQLLTLFATSICLSNVILAQTNIFSKVYYNNSNSTNGYSVTKAFDNGFIICGSYNYDPLIFKLDSAGTILWSKKYVVGSGSNSEFTSITRTNDSNFVAVGRNYVSSLQQVFCVKINGTGDTLWSRLINTGVPGGSNPLHLQQTSDHGFIITGLSNFSSAPYSKILVIKLDSLGNVQWDKNLTSGNNANTGNIIRETPDSGFVIGSYVENSPPYDANAVLIKLTSTGNVSWSKKYNTSSSSASSFNDILILSDGLLSFITTNSGYACLMKTDFLGNIIWSKQPGYSVLSSYQVSPKLHSTYDGGYIFVNGNGGGGSGTELVKTDSSGNALWEKSLFLEAVDLVEANDSGIFIIGNGPLMGVGPHSAGPGSPIPQIGVIKTDSLGNEPFCAYDYTPTNMAIVLTVGTVSVTSTVLGGGVVTHPVITNPTLSIVNGCVDFFGGIHESELSNSISIYPNPFTNQTTLTFEKEHSDAVLKIVNVLGEEVYNTLIPKSTTNFTIDKGNLNSGIYFIQVQTAKGTISKKIIIQ